MGIIVIGIRNPSEINSSFQGGRCPSWSLMCLRLFPQELWWGVRGAAVGRGCHGSQPDESCAQRYRQAVHGVSPAFRGSVCPAGCMSFKNQLFQTDWLALKPLKAVGLFTLVKGIVPIYLKYSTLLWVLTVLVHGLLNSFSTLWVLCEVKENKPCYDKEAVIDALAEPQRYFWFWRYLLALWWIPVITVSKCLLSGLFLFLHETQQETVSFLCYVFEQWETALDL